MPPPSGRAKPALASYREPTRGYGRACAAGVAQVRADAEIVCFLDGDGSDVPRFMADIVGPVARGEADFVMGSRLRGQREAGSMTPQQLVAGRLAGALLRAVYGVRFTDMSPFRAMRVDRLRRLGMAETTYGWNLEMQMRVAAAGLRIREIPVDHRRRRGGESKVSGNLTAGLSAAWKIPRRSCACPCPAPRTAPPVIPAAAVALERDARAGTCGNRRSPPQIPDSLACVSASGMTGCSS